MKGEWWNECHDTEMQIQHAPSTTHPTESAVRLHPLSQGMRLPRPAAQGAHVPMKMGASPLIPIISPDKQRGWARERLRLLAVLKCTFRWHGVFLYFVCMGFREERPSTAQPSPPFWPWSWLLVWPHSHKLSREVWCRPSTCNDTHNIYLTQIFKTNASDILGILVSTYQARFSDSY